MHVFWIIPVLIILRWIARDWRLKPKTDSPPKRRPPLNARAADLDQHMSEMGESLALIAVKFCKVVFAVLMVGLVATVIFFLLAILAGLGLMVAC
jgi:hypothetical protein